MSSGEDVSGGAVAIFVFSFLCREEFEHIVFANLSTDRCLECCAVESFFALSLEPMLEVKVRVGFVAVEGVEDERVCHFDVAIVVREGILECFGVVGDLLKPLELARTELEDGL